MNARILTAALLLSACGSVYGENPGDGEVGVDAGVGDDEVDGAPVVEPNLVFTTAAFTDVGVLGGVDGADALCNQEAAAAGLSGSYTAWLSDESSDARDRLGDASGWIRTDGRPFAATIDDIAAGRILYPPRIDERGVDRLSSIWTATRPDGTYDGRGSCGGWTDPAPARSATTGTSHGGMRRFTDSVTLPCDFSMALLCLGNDRAGSITAPESTGPVAFVSLGRLAGDEGGSAPYDALCAAEANAAGLAGSFAAAVSLAGQPISNRLIAGGPSWSRPDGVEVFADRAALVGGDMSAPIEVTAGGEHLDDAAWTGAGSWSIAGANCSDYTDATATGLLGRTALSDTGGSTAITGDCSDRFPVYCFQQ